MRRGKYHNIEPCYCYTLPDHGNKGYLNTKFNNGYIKYLTAVGFTILLEKDIMHKPLMCTRSKPM